MDLRNHVSLNIMVRGKKLELIEAPAGATPVVPTRGEELLVSGQKVLLYGSEAYPSALIDFTLENRREVLTRREVVEMIEYVQKAGSR